MALPLDSEEDDEDYAEAFFSEDSRVASSASSGGSSAWLAQLRDWMSQRRLAAYMISTGDAHLRLVRSFDILLSPYAQRVHLRC